MRKAALSQGLGGRTERLPYEFDRYDADWEVKLDGEPVDSIPLFYEGSGDVCTDQPLVVEVPVVGGSRVPEFDAVSKRALADGVSAAVIATRTESGLLMAVNRRPVLGSGLPTVCVAGAVIERLRVGRVEVHLRAKTVLGRSANVIALFGEGKMENRVLLTTPLSGWFQCAAERGGGIAVCLETAKALAREVPVAVLGTTGHELMGLGVLTYLANQPPSFAGIFHFGANFAAGVRDSETGKLRLPSRIGVNGWVTNERRTQLREAFRHLGTPIGVFDDSTAANVNNWVGESRGWAELRTPMVSMAGPGPLHHAPEDVPERATTPEILDAVYRGALDAARLLVPNRRPGD